MKETIQTPVTEKLGIKVPILLAGMSGVSHGELAAAVSNAGGLGVIGGLTLSPKVLKKEIDDLKAHLTDKNLPFGVDLAIPQVGGNARKTNHDYTHGKLPELIDLIIAEKASLFVCAVGVPPQWAVDKLHAAGIPIMNMVGAPKHVDKAIASGVDLICAQGTEGGGHTGEIGTLALIQQCVDRCKGHKSQMDGSPIMVIGAGGIVNGASIAAALSLGAEAVWVGTRFVASEESHASDRHKARVLEIGALDTTRTLVYSGRPLRAYQSPYIREWHTKRASQIEELCSKGVIPFNYDLKEAEKNGEHFDLAGNFPQLIGQGCGLITEVKPAGAIVEEMMTEAVEILRKAPSRIAKL
ncbi:Nitronate monooxygenase [Hondaea fermentalgiana]|uniref:Nitronate monooxygenase n=1 Tax=Hondaea fermentalgiana TaxID=2315210 RepID=A0A2R5GYC1_9STRA|nr:Nitronate monooxygenase [Hondaea fermentalgiana]|eukprot:GBG34808.1 Nitronate monooxygenase [Hondaea fermentalgiana]